MNREALLRALSVPFRFSDLPNPIVAELRVSWRIPIIAFALRKCCYADRSSLIRLHILSWGTRSPENGNVLITWLNGVADPGQVIVRFEPSLFRAVDLGIGWNLFKRPKGDRVQLSETGAELVEAVEKADVMNAERAFLTRLGTSLTEKVANRLIREFR